MYYLAQALTSAKSAASLGSEDVEFTSSLQERIDVAQVQSEVGRAIAGHKEMTAEEKNDSLKQLDSRLLGLDEVSWRGHVTPLELNIRCTKVTRVRLGYTSPFS
jgi:nuclear pore complex protein Nup155